MTIDRDKISIAAGICVAAPFFSRGRMCHACCEQQRIEIEVGEDVDMAVSSQFGLVRWSLLRRPQGSRASVHDARLQTIDRAGAYIVRGTGPGLWIRELALCAFTDAQMYGLDVEPSENLRLQKRSWLNDPTTTTEMVIARLEISR